MNINWIRDEILKNEEEIDWISIIDISKKYLRERSKSNSTIGITKGVLNFVKISSLVYTNTIKSDLEFLYSDIKFYCVNTQSQVIKLIKDNAFNKEDITNNKVVLICEKSTIETVFRRYDIPYIKFTFREYTRSGKSAFTWKKEGERGITWGKEKLKGIKREEMLNKILN